ncbi:MAG: 2-phospho-L-lactate guanylyltransferase [Actinomycetota bacterium]|nr:2-phospho-L-lactate guanylyltransferase [Actinomycetota bacterium]
MTGDEEVARPAAGAGEHGAARGRTGEQAVLVPVKSFAHAKGRLTSALNDADRRTLVRRMAEQVLHAAAPLPVAVVCDDPEVADWARSHGAIVLWEPGRGLNGAVQSGVAQLAGLGVRRVVVAHADLPLARDLAGLVGFGGVTLVPDRRDDGTNVIELPTDAGFRFSYGPGSFSRHRAESLRLGLDVRVLREPSLSYDVDWPSDLPTAGGQAGGDGGRTG